MTEACPGCGQRDERIKELEVENAVYRPIVRAVDRAMTDDREWASVHYAWRALTPEQRARIEGASHG